MKKLFVLAALLMATTGRPCRQFDFLPDRGTQDPHRCAEELQFAVLHQDLGAHHLRFQLRQFQGLQVEELQRRCRHCRARADRRASARPCPGRSGHRAAARRPRRQHRAAASPAPAAPTTVATVSPVPAVGIERIARPGSGRPPRAPQPAPVAAAPAPAPTTPLGVWATEENKGNVRIEECGQNLCGYAVKTGEKILINMKPQDFQMDRHRSTIPTAAAITTRRSR